MNFMLLAKIVHRSSRSEVATEVAKTQGDAYACVPATCSDTDGQGTSFACGASREVRASKIGMRFSERVCFSCSIPLFVFTGFTNFHVNFYFF